MKGKRYIDAAKQVNNTAYEANEAIKLACELAKAKFDETMELHVKLGVDPKQADQQVRGVLVLPHGTGRDLKVLVIAKGAKADEAAAAGAAGAAAVYRTDKQAETQKISGMER